METPALAGLVFLILVAPVALWVAWSDMARMRIPNLSLLALVLIFLVAGPFVLPLGDWAWRWTHLPVVLLIGFLANQIRLMGAGDAKFAAAAAPFIAVGDLLPLVIVYAAILLGGFAAHRAMKHFPPFRNAVPEWASWSHAKFPMGLVLGPGLAAYLALAAIYGS